MSQELKNKQRVEIEKTKITILLHFYCFHMGLFHDGFIFHKRNYNDI
jgi:hypothetical protein